MGLIAGGSSMAQGWVGGLGGKSGTCAALSREVRTIGAAAAAMLPFRKLRRLLTVSYGSGRSSVSRVFMAFLLAGVGVPHARRRHVNK